MAGPLRGGRQSGADGVKPEDYAALVPALFSMTNIVGALVTMPHKIATCGLVDQLSPTAAIAGACNAIRREADGSLRGDMFDGEGFVLGIKRKGFQPQGARAQVFGCGGVGSAIAASLAAAGVSTLTLFDTSLSAAEALAQRLNQHYPRLEIVLMQGDPAAQDLVVNATPLGMKADDPLPLDVSRLSPRTWVGEVVMSVEYTPLLRAAQALGCPIQRGTDMLFEMIGLSRVLPAAGGDAGTAARTGGNSLLNQQKRRYPGAMFLSL